MKQLNTLEQIIEHLGDPITIDCEKSQFDVGYIAGRNKVIKDLRNIKLIQDQVIEQQRQQLRGTN